MYDRFGQCTAGVKMLLVDACRDIRGGDKATSVSFRRPSGTFALFSCSPGERSYELTKFGHGAFFQAVLDGLKGAAKDEEDNVTWQDLSEYVRSRVRNDVAQVYADAVQSPQDLSSNVRGVPVILAV